MFDHYLKRWALTLDGDALVSLNGHLLPVRQGDTPAMLKIAHSPEEQAGNQLMACGAVMVRPRYWLMMARHC